MKPHFVRAELRKDGTVELIDDDGEEFHVQMVRGDAWPILSRRVRRFELEEGRKKGGTAPTPEPPVPRGYKLRLVE